MTTTPSLVRPDPKVHAHEPGPHESPCSQCGLVHERCQAHAKSTGAACGRWPKDGAPVCRKHGGAARQVERARVRRLALGQAEVEVELERERRLQLGGVLPVDPADAMLEMVAEAAWNVAMLRDLVRRLEAGEIDAIEVEREDGEMVPGLGLGSTLAIKTGSDKKPNEAQPHVWVAMYDAERARLMEWSKQCRAAGVEERRVQVVEDQARMLADAMRVLVKLLGAAALELVGNAKDRARLAALFDGGWAPYAREALETITTEGNER